MQPILDALVQGLIVPTILGVIAAGAAWLATKLPGPLRDALKNSASASASQERVQDVGRLVSAMGRAASEGARTGDTSTASVVAYAEREAADLVHKVAPSAAVLATMAGAAVQGAALQTATIAAASAPAGPLPVVVVDAATSFAGAVQPGAVPPVPGAV